MCLEQNSIGKRPKDFEASGFPSCILNNTHFFGDVQQTKWSMQKVLLYYEDFVYQASELYSPCYQQTKWYMEKIPCVTGLYVPSIRTTTYVCNRVNTSFCTKDQKTH